MSYMPVVHDKCIIKKMSCSKRICIITCYRQPDYVRATALRQAVSKIDCYEPIIIKNSNTGLFRYIEVLLSLVITRIRHNPDVYILTFRGYEILPFVRIISFGKKLVFDEFINLIEWLAYEHHKVKEGSFSFKLIKGLYRYWLNKVDVILTDTKSHAECSSSIMSLPIEKYKTVFVGNDESVFNSKALSTLKNKKGDFKVLYYGSMLPLHGIDYVIEAACIVRDQVRFTIIGGNQTVAEKVKEANKKGANIDYMKWVDFDKLPGYVNNSDLCLAGPFGGTYQSQYVITGKAYQFLSMRKPVIMGINYETSIFSDQKNALLVKQKSAHDLAIKILWAKNNKIKLRSIGLRGYDLYTEKFSSVKMHNNVKNLLFNLFKK